MAEAPFVLFHLDSCLATPGPQDRRGKLERLMPHPVAVHALDQLAQLEPKPDIGVVRTNTLKDDLWVAIQGSPLRTRLNKERNCFGTSPAREDARTVLTNATRTTGVGTAGRVGVFVTTVLRTEAVALGWRVCDSSCFTKIVDALANPQLPLLAIRCGRAALEAKLQSYFENGFRWHIASDDSGETHYVAGTPRSPLDVADRIVVKDSRGCLFTNVHGSGLTELQSDEYVSSLRQIEAFTLREDRIEFAEKLAKTDRFIVLTSGDAHRTLPHPALVNHGHFRNFRSSDCPDAPEPIPPPPLEARPLTNPEIDAIKYDMSPAFYASTHSRLYGRKPLRNDAVFMRNRTVRTRGNIAATRLVARRFERILGQTNVYRTIDPTRPYPMYSVEGRISGDDSSAGIVILAAHFDSIATKPGVGTWENAAPGADDDASGVAAVMYAARVLESFRPRPRREIRFVLFNDEENRMGGSEQYVKDLLAESEATGLQVAAMLQVDMIGWRSRYYDERGLTPGVALAPDPFWERKYLWLKSACQAIRESLLDAAKALDLKPWLSEWNAASDTYLSDQESFLKIGIPACLVAERGLDSTGRVGDPPRRNPHYHSAGDDHIDVDMAFHLTQIITAATWMMAKH